MPKITDANIQELSLVFAVKDGVEFAPRNPNAKILAVKAKPADQADAIAAAKALLKKAGEWPVTEDVADGVDGDGDGADDYNELTTLLSRTFQDLQQAMYLDSDKARSNAVKTVLDEFKEKIEAAYAGKDADKKAGARHSAADKARLDSMGDKIGAMAKAHAKMGKQLDGMAELHASLTTAADKPKDGEGDDDDPQDDADAMKAAAVAKADDVEYADAANKKYPVDTKEHAKAAWSYINMPKNADKYESSELVKVKAKIKAACEKFGIEISDDKAAPVAAAQAVDAAAIAALVGETLKAQFAEIDAKFVAQRSALDTRFAAIEKAATEKAATVEKSALEKSLALIKAARTPSVPAVTQQYQGDGADGQPIMRTAPHIERVDSSFRFDPMMSATGESGAIQGLLRATRLAQS